MEAFINKVKNLSPKQVMLLAIEQQKKLLALGKFNKEPIAIVGAACRMPAGANDLASYWQLMLEGRDGILTSTNERWDMDEFYDENKSTPGKMYTRRLGLVDGVDKFDAEFFGIAPKEAERMDPQQRFLLETCWHALEHAGQTPKTLIGSRTGVFIGACNQDYTNLRMGIANRFGHHTVTPYDGTGTTFSVAAGRIAYSLGLQGPCFTVDTACSSSLVALHLAAQSLLNNEADMAICAGVSLILDPTTSIIFSKANMLAPDGRCKTFDAKADGYVRGEGCGAVILKRLSVAEKNGDRILGLLVGSALNQDGASQGLTAPNENAQADLLRDALRNAGLKAGDIDYIEAHGTGTSLGDPIEMSAIGSVFGKREHNNLQVGSVKTNIGHTEAASGMAGLIKVLLSLQHEIIPPHINFSEPSPLIPWDELSVSIPTVCQPWPRSAKTRYAGVSSFGFSGSNAHVIIAEAPAQKVSDKPVQVNAIVPFILPLSAKTPAALEQQARQIAGFIEKNPHMDLASLCSAAATGRTHFNLRNSLVVDDITQLREQLHGPVSANEIGGCTAANTAFLFSGQGSQYWGMARELYQHNIYFKRHMDECEQLLADQVDISLGQLLWGADEQLLNNTRYTQPALFAVQYSMAKLWQHWGMAPSFVLGHSVGEYVAACIAGVFSLADALKLIAARGRLMVETCAPGSMAVVFKPVDEVRRLLVTHGQQLDIAAINGPENTVVSGEKEVVQAFLAQLDAQDIRTTALVVSHGFHSTMMEPMLREFREIAHSVTYQYPQLTLISNVTGKPAYDELCSADYWVNHVRAPVNFYRSIESLIECGINICVEVGPGSSLLGMAKHIVGAGGRNGGNYHWFASLRRNASDWRVLVESLAGLYTLGLDIDWKAFYESTDVQQVDLPGYPFQHSQYWMAQHKPGDSFNLVTRRTDKPTDGHLLLGKQLDIALSDNRYFENSLSLDTPGYMDEHRLYGVPVVAGASHVSALLQAAASCFARESGLKIYDIAFSKALVLMEREGNIAPSTKVQIVVNHLDDKRHSFSACLLSQSPDNNNIAANNWHTHVTAKMACSENVPLSPISLSELQERLENDIAPELFYQGFWQKGYTVGSAFKWLGQGGKGKSQALRELDIAGRAEISEDYLFYPGLLDACFQVIDRADPNLSNSKNDDSLFVPYSITEFNFYQKIEPGKKLYCYVDLLVDSLDDKGSRIVSDLWILTEDNQVLAFIKNFEARKTTRLVLQTALARTPVANQEQGIFTEQWYLLDEQEDQTIPAVQQAPLIVFAGEADTPWLQVLDNNTRRPIIVVRAGADDCAAPTAIAGQKIQELELAINNAQHWQSLREIMDRLDNGTWEAIYAWGLDVQPILAEQLEQLDEPGDMALWWPLLQFLQQVQATGFAKVSHIALVSRRGRAVIADEPVDPVQHMMWGMARCAMLELGNIQVQIFDIDSADQTTLSRLLNIVDGNNSLARTEQIAFRNHKLYINRLEPAAASTQDKFPSLDRQKIYVISGGYGGLGIAVAQSLVANGARHLALLGRHAPSPKIMALLEPLANQAQIHCLQADVSDYQSLANAFSQLPANASIGGVVHASGVLLDGFIGQITAQSFQHVTRAKVQGAWNLHRLTLAHQPEFFVMFSSIAAALGSAGQTNYAAANAFLDGLAQLRRSLGLAASSIQWAPWGESGMATRLDDRHLGLMAARGLEALSNQRGLAMFQKVYSGAYTGTLLAADIDWNLYVNSLPFTPSTRPAIYQSLVCEQAIAEQYFIDDLLALPAAERIDALQGYLQALLAKTLGFRDKRKIKIRDKFFDIGLDSLLAVELKNTLEKNLRRSLSSTLLFDYPNLEKLVDYLGQGLSDSDESKQQADSSVQVMELQSAGSDDLGYDDIAALLDDSRLDMAESLVE